MAFPNTIVASDLHLSDTPRDDYRFKFIERVLPALLKKHKIQDLHILGDLTEVKDFHSARLVNRIADAITFIAEMATVTILTGNHDYTDPGNPFFRFLSMHGNIRFITKPELQGGTLYLPHTREPAKEWTAPNLFKGVKRIFAHQTFNGATGGFGRKLEGADLSLLPNVPVYAGDVHVPQKFENLTYVGAPYSVDFGDDYQGRVLMIGVTPKGKDQQQSIAVDMPQKFVYHVTDLSKLPKDQFVKGDIVRVDVPIKRADYAQWDSVRRLIRAWGEGVGVRIESVQPKIIDKQAARNESAKRDLHKAENDDVVLTEYCKLNGVDERTAKIGLGLLT